MKKILIALGFVFAFGAATAQEKGTKVLGIKIGGAMPTGEFAEYDGGNAESGINLEIKSEYFIQDNFAITLIGRSQANSIDAQALADDLGRSTGANVEVSSESWAIGQLLVGVHGLIPIGNANVVFVSGRIAAGLITATSPDIKGRIYDSQSSMNFTIDESTGSGFGYLIGSGFTFNVSSLINLNLAVDYTGGSVDFDNVRSSTTSSDGTNVSYEDTDQSFSTTNISLGIDFKF